MEELDEQNLLKYCCFEEDYYPQGNPSNPTINLDIESKNEEQKGCSSTNSNNPNIDSEKRDYNDNHLTNGGNDIYSLDYYTNVAKEAINKKSTESLNKNSTGENKINSNENMSTINGNQIITSNLIINNKKQELFNSTEINFDNLKKMQMLKQKRKRRKKAEVLKERNQKMHIEIKKEKRIGRLKKVSKGKVKANHSNDADDNIVKKINTALLESIRNWANSSFLDDTLKFQDKRFMEKHKKIFLAKLRPDLITNIVNKDFILRLINTKFKDIFSDYLISPKYKNSPPDNNKKLIKIIYKDNKQPFIRYILELTFLEGLNYFNGEISDETVKSYFNENFNYSEELINEFIGKFDKIGKFMDDFCKKSLKDGKNEEETKDYLNKFIVLCLNYKQSFEKKYKRTENKNKKKKIDEQQ